MEGLWIVGGDDSSWVGVGVGAVDELLVFVVAAVPLVLGVLEGVLGLAFEPAECPSD